MLQVASSKWTGFGCLGNLIIAYFHYKYNYLRLYSNMNDVLEKTEETGKLTYYDLKKSAGKPVAKIFSDGKLKALDTESDGKPRVVFTCSTNAVDLVADVMELSALEKMRDTFPGMTFWRDHRYDVPDCVIGVIEKAELVTREFTNSVDGKRDKYLCLDCTVRIATSNPAAVKTYELIKNDEVKLGASISVIITESAPSSKGIQLVKDVYPLEISCVGIPAERNSWVQSIQKAFKEWERSGKVAPAENKPELEQVSVKEQKEMSETTPTEQQIVTKNVFDDVIAFDTEMTCYDLAYSLCNAVSNLLGQAGGGYMANAAGMLDELLNDFSQAVKTLVGPTLESLSTSSGDSGEAKSAEQGQGQGDSKVIAPTVEQLKAYFTWQEKSVAPANDKENDAKPYQDMHDYLVSKGAACQHDAPNETGTTTSSADNKDVSQALSVNNKALELEITNLKTELATAKTKSAQWEAISKKLKEKLQEYLKQPLSV
jgi:hypothetical protein